MSPNGRLLVVVVGAQGKRDSLAVIDLADNKIYPTAGFDDGDIGQVQWVNNKRLMFDTTDKQIGRRDSAFGPGLYAKNYDGSGFKQLTYRSGQQFVTEVHNTAPLETLPWNTIMMRQDGAQDSNFAYVSRRTRCAGCSTSATRRASTTARRPPRHGKRWPAITCTRATAVTRRLRSGRTAHCMCSTARARTSSRCTPWTWRLAK